MKYNYKENFNKELLKGKIVMAFTDSLDCLDEDYAEDSIEEEDKYFTDDFTGEGIHTYYVFDTPEEFISKWEEICYEPHGMWYWCLNDGECFCSGACDPNDIDIFEEYFGLGDKDAEEEDYD